ncbi:uncharacterized protein EV422DRAFT_572326 [Fimicolochytrium jonesii]|uniref:uncharacterized protein n=1 Tax=Fimicolochytrium jonesii TaxID=1396493 RepID=UPI0022FE5E41|nr:uncharacterized protein EV422DRAFT_572326 [Fimicolochytrium jonesii]KAI8815851.1 hypothetical protein EV422DRAFT_572326 [Fimicolochytrium jonesii]
MSPLEAILSAVLGTLLLHLSAVQAQATVPLGWSLNCVDACARGANGGTAPFVAAPFCSDTLEYYNNPQFYNLAYGPESNAPRNRCENVGFANPLPTYDINVCYRLFIGLGSAKLIYRRLSNGTFQGCFAGADSGSVTVPCGCGATSPSPSPTSHPITSVSSSTGALAPSSTNDPSDAVLPIGTSQQTPSGPIIGAAVGIAMLLAIAFGVCIWYRKRRNVAGASKVTGSGPPAAPIVFDRSPGSEAAQATINGAGDTDDALTTIGTSKHPAHLPTSFQLSLSQPPVPFLPATHATYQQAQVQPPSHAPSEANPPSTGASDTDDAPTRVGTSKHPAHLPTSWRLSLTEPSVPLLPATTATDQPAQIQPPFHAPSEVSGPFTGAHSTPVIQTLHSHQTLHLPPAYEETTWMADVPALEHDGQQLPLRHAVQDHFPSHSTELGMKCGDVVAVEQALNAEWYIAQNRTRGGRGLVPCSLLSETISSGPSPTVAGK